VSAGERFVARIVHMDLSRAAWSYLIGRKLNRQQLVSPTWISSRGASDARGGDQSWVRGLRGRPGRGARRRQAKGWPIDETHEKPKESFHFII
jgi:hypothetical protein